MKNLLFALSIVLLVGSCKSWSDNDKLQFMEKCESVKFNAEQCDCFLNKTMDKYESWSDIKEDQEAMAAILSNKDCLEKEASTEE